jgi:hypothetical protein
VIEIQFKNMYPSTLAKEMVLKRLKPILERFSLVQNNRVYIYVELCTNNHYNKKDEFSVSLKVSGKDFKNFQIKKSAASLFQAASDLSEILELQMKNKLS